MKIPLRTRVRAWACAAAWGASSAAVAAADPVPPDFDAALQAYERNHWAQAFAAFAQRADQGDAESARIALQMWAWGPRLYGTRFAASAQQVDLWRQRSRAVATLKESR